VVPCTVSCDQFQWQAGEWSGVCTTLAAASDDLQCGPGLQSRSVRSAGRNMLLLASTSHHFYAIVKMHLQQIVSAHNTLFFWLYVAKASTIFRFYAFPFISFVL